MINQRGPEGVKPEQHRQKHAPTKGNGRRKNEPDGWNPPTISEQMSRSLIKETQDDPELTAHLTKEAAARGRVAAQWPFKTG
eukprot:4925289-Amphidinium_carterae.2